MRNSYVAHCRYDNGIDLKLDVLAFTKVEASWIAAEYFKERHPGVAYTFTLKRTDK